MSVSFRKRIAVALAMIACLLGAASVALAGDAHGTVSHHRGTENLVVFVAHAAGTFAPPHAHAIMDQRRMRFAPFVLPVVVGTTVEFQNHDSVVHNVFSPDGDAYNLGTWSPGMSRTHQFTAAGVYTQACSLHPEMEAYVLVLQNPYYAVTAANGSFTITGIPDGNYEVQVWGKKLSSAEKRRRFPLHVTGGTATSVIAF